MASPKKTTEVVEIAEINMEEIQFHIVGTSPLIMERFNQKAWHELLLPKPKESRATLESKLKHDPVAEFRSALYLNRDPKTPTLIHVPSGAFHGALAQAGVDIPGAAKARIERLTSVSDLNVCLYGTPSLYCAMVRNSDMNRTPDVRTRPIFEEWATTVNVKYVRQLMTSRTISNLIGASGVIVGIGGWRPQKGGPFGTFRIASADDAEFKRIVKTQGRSAQQVAFDEPGFYDEDTAELIAWFDSELIRREQTALTSDGAPKGKKRKVIVENGRGEVVTTDELTA